jgi:hypothetical protein
VCKLVSTFFGNPKREIMVELLANLGRSGFGQNKSDK